MRSRVGSFALGFATGAITVVALRRLKECRDDMSYERLADSVQNKLQKLEARIGSSDVVAPKRTGKGPK